MLQSYADMYARPSVIAPAVIGIVVSCRVRNHNGPAIGPPVMAAVVAAVTPAGRHDRTMIVMDPIGWPHVYTTRRRSNMAMWRNGRHPSSYIPAGMGRRHVHPVTDRRVHPMGGGHVDSMA